MEGPQCPKTAPWGFHAWAARAALTARAERCQWGRRGARASPGLTSSHFASGLCILPRISISRKLACMASTDAPITRLSASCNGQGRAHRGRRSAERLHGPGRLDSKRLASPGLRDAAAAIPRAWRRPGAQQARGARRGSTHGMHRARFPPPAGREIPVKLALDSWGAAARNAAQANGELTSVGFTPALVSSRTTARVSRSPCASMSIEESSRLACAAVGRVSGEAQGPTVASRRSSAPSRSSAEAQGTGRAGGPRSTTLLVRCA